MILRTFLIRIPTIPILICSYFVWLDMFGLFLREKKTNLLCCAILDVLFSLWSCCNTVRCWTKTRKNTASRRHGHGNLLWEIKLVGVIPAPLKKKKSVGIMTFPTEWEKTCSKPPTRTMLHGDYKAQKNSFLDGLTVVTSMLIPVSWDALNLGDLGVSENAVQAPIFNHGCFGNMNGTWQAGFFCSFLEVFPKITQMSIDFPWILSLLDGMSSCPSGTFARTRKKSGGWALPLWKK